MITDTQKITIERSGVSREGKFTVKSGAHIMRILRDKIYSNKVLACLREYSTNAWEAHRLNNNEHTPIEITLPNLIDPMLKIRDFGPGLTFDQIEKLICSYGETTKDNSNEFAGCFGIGSKAAFSYSNTFQITSICNGSKVIANCYIDETEEGRISELFHGPANDDEKSGIEIAIPVQLCDMGKFADEAKNLFRFWDLPPTVKGHAGYTPMVNSWYLRNPAKDWGFLDKQGYYATAYIVMGGIAYRLDGDKIGNLDSIHERILDKSLVIFAKIGDVTIAANREEVDYTPKTIGFVKEFLRKIEIEAKTEIDSEFTKCVTEYETRKLFYSYFRGGAMDNVMTQLFSGSYKAKLGINEIGTSVFEEDDTRMNKIHEFQYCYTRRGRYTVKARMGASIDLFSKLDVTPPPTNGFFFYYVGEEDFPRVNKLIKYYISEVNSNRFNREHIVVNFKTEQDKTDWLTEKGIPVDTFTELFSTIIIPKKPRKPREAREANPKTNCAVFDPNELIPNKDKQHYENYGWHYYDVDLDNPELAGPHYYVIKHYSNFFLDVVSKNRNEYYDSARVTEVIKMLGEISQNFKDCKVVYALNESELVKLKDNPDWILLRDFAKDELQVQHDRFDNTLIPINHCGFNRESLTLLKLIKDGSFKLDSTNEIHGLLPSFDFSEDTPRIVTYDNLTSLLKVDPKGYSQEIINRMRELIEAEEKNYPLLSSLRYYSDTDLPEIVLYLNAKQLQLAEKIAQDGEKVVDSTVKTSDDVT